MIKSTDFADRVRSAFNVGPLVVIVDELLRVAAETPLRLDPIDVGGRFQAADGSGRIVDVPMRGGAFRAILARLGKMCRDHSPDSVSLYGGHGRLISDSTEFAVNFMNSETEQWATVMAAAPEVVPITSQEIEPAPAV